MVHTSSLAALAASALLVPSTLAAGAIYTKSSPVLQVDAKSYDSLIARSNHTTILEFYAPWCGHCQNLKPAYEKAAKSLSGLAKVAAINCDDESNKPFCGSMGVQGFPTLKIVRPGKKPGRPNVEDYNGERSAKAIVSTVKDKIPNHVKRVADKDLDDWLAKGNDTAKAILFSDKGTTSALLKALAIDYLGSISVAQIRNKEAAAVGTFGVTSYPTFILLPGGTADAIVYPGDMTKDGLTAFLSQVAPPNPDPAPKAAKGKSSKSSSPKDSKKSAKASSAFSQSSASHRSADSASTKASQTAETLEEASNPTASPDPKVVTDDSQKPIQVPDITPAIPGLSTLEMLQQSCLTRKSGICILALLPGESGDSAALTSLSEIRHKHTQRGGKLFPFYSVPASAAETLRAALDLKGDALQIVAVNAKKAWVKKLGDANGHDAIESWIDAIRMGEGEKDKLSDSLLVEPVAKQEVPEQKTEPVAGEPKAKADAPLGVQVEELSPEEVERMLEHARKVGKQPAESEAKAEHDEL
ncbi:hypothetical protein MBLNU459_g4366t1 [Dothideomycetes sp. NU459]